MKKVFIFILLFVLTGCSYDKNLDFSYDEVKILNIGEMTRLKKLFDDEWVSDDENIISLQEQNALAVGVGLTYVRSQNKIVTFYVKEEIKEILVEGKRNIEIGEETLLQAIIKPLQISQKVNWESLDENIAIVNDGKVTGVNTGLATIKVVSDFDSSKFTFFQILVTSKDSNIDAIIEESFKQETIKVNNISGYFYPLVNQYKDSVIGVSNYNINGKLDSIGSGVIYKRIEIKDNNILKGYQYYVITNRHVVKDAHKVKIHTLKLNNEIDAEVIEYDDQVDIALVTFISNLYFPVAKIGNSDIANTGEIIITMGHPRGYEYFNSISLGIISYPERYMSSDTDDDGKNDWDALYIQHDAAINAGNSGGPVINLKGEVIGINTAKITAYNIDNMGFAIPINLVMEIISLLEQGKKPVRAKLGVTVLSVKDILISRAYYASQGIIVPDDCDYGFYIIEVSPTGIAYLAGIEAGDILISFNNVKMQYSYILRAEISRFIIGSGEVVPLEVYRNGELLTLYVTY